MSQQTDFTKRYIATILKKVVSEIHSNQRRKERATERSMVTSKSANEVRSMRHWRASGDIEFFYAETEKGFCDMKQLDDLTGWSGNLHQTRFSFMKEKHGAILGEYLKRYRSKEAE